MLFQSKHVKHSSLIYLRKISLLLGIGFECFQVYYFFSVGESELNLELVVWSKIVCIYLAWHNVLECTCNGHEDIYQQVLNVGYSWLLLKYRPCKLFSFMPNVLLLCIHRINIYRPIKVTFHYFRLVVLEHTLWVQEPKCNGSTDSDPFTDSVDQCKEMLLALQGGGSPVQSAASS